MLSNRNVRSHQNQNSTWYSFLFCKDIIFTIILQPSVNFWWILILLKHNIFLTALKDIPLRELTALLPFLVPLKTILGHSFNPYGRRSTSNKYHFIFLGFLRGTNKSHFIRKPWKQCCASYVDFQSNAG